MRFNFRREAKWTLLLGALPALLGLLALSALYVFRLIR